MTPGLEPPGRPRVVVVGLGPAGPGLVQPAALDAMASAPALYLRTNRHPAASVAPGAPSFDHLYETARSFEEVYGGIVDALVHAAEAQGRVAYAVPGSPLVGEQTVELLRESGRVEVEVLPGMSFLDLAWERLRIDPLAAGVRLVDAAAFMTGTAGERGPFLVAQCWSKQLLSGVKLAAEDEPEQPVTVLQRLGLPNEAVYEVAWADLDRRVGPDHLTSLYIPQLAAPLAGEMAALDEVMRELRERCPWDREQTHASLVKHLVEESGEVVEAIAEVGAGLPGAYAHLEEELGDLLVQVLFHSRLAAEAGRFTVADVARTVRAKLVHRHPHVFGDARADTVEEAEAIWEQVKAAPGEPATRGRGI